MQANQRKQYQTNLQVHAKYEISIKFAQQIRGNIVQMLIQKYPTRKKGNCLIKEQVNYHLNIHK